MRLIAKTTVIREDQSLIRLGLKYSLLMRNPLSPDLQVTHSIRQAEMIFDQQQISICNDFSRTSLSMENILLEIMLVTVVVKVKATAPTS